jgi:hypothetical protein
VPAGARLRRGRRGRTKRRFTGRTSPPNGGTMPAGGVASGGSA